MLRAGDRGRAGYYSDIEEPAIGGGLLIGIGQSGRVFANPNVEIVFVDRADFLTINGDFHYDFETSTDWSWWLGGGPALLYFDPDFGNDDTDVGVNLLAGAGAREGRVRPFVQGKITLADESEAVIAFGIRF